MLCCVQSCSVAMETLASARIVVDVAKTWQTQLLQSLQYPACTVSVVTGRCQYLLYLTCTSVLQWVCAIIILAVTVVASNSSIASSLC